MREVKRPGRVILAGPFCFCRSAAGAGRRLSRLGWTQQEIADVVGISRPRVSGIVSFGQLAKTDNGSQPELQLEESTQSDSIPTPEGVQDSVSGGGIMRVANFTDSSLSRGGFDVHRWGNVV